MRSCHVCRKGNLTLFAGRQMDSNDMMASQWRDDLTLILHPIHTIADNGSPVVQVKESLIIAILRMPRHRNIQVTKRLKGHTHVFLDSTGHHLRVCQCLCLLVFPFENQFAHLRQRLLGIGVDDVIGLSRPDCLLVQLDVFYGRGAEHHTAYDTITHGQCLSPRLCRLVVPQSVLRPYSA